MRTRATMPARCRRSRRSLTRPPDTSTDRTLTHTPTHPQLPVCVPQLMKLNPEFKFTPFKAAVAKTCAWFEANYDTVRKGH